MLINLIGCGYKPSAKFARDILGNKISTDVSISKTDPENSVIIKDAVDKAIIEIFHASLVERRYADTHLMLSISVPSYKPLQYDTNGFIISYRATITLKISRETNDMKKNYISVGTYDFSIVPNAVLTEQERFDAIKFSSFKAISAFVAQVSAEGSQVK
nr:LPS assembly lipoprotein LptE [Sulfurimonas sp. SAG-AH-194-C20]